MTGTEILVILGGLGIGFWAVNSHLAPKEEKPKGAKQTSSDSSSSHQQSANNSGQSHQSRQKEEQKPEEKDISTSWHRILEVPQSASADDIAKSYKQKIRQYHPDKVASLGPELQELAEKKSKEINTAYDYAIKLKG